MIEFEGNSFYLDGAEWAPTISTESNKQDANTLLISIDVGMESSLKWKDALKKAEAARDEGKKILWHLDIGAVSRLLLPLKDPSFAASVSLAVKHFADNVLPEFENATLGVLLYQGGLDFYQQGVLKGDYSDDFEIYKKNLGLQKIYDTQLHQLPDHVLGAIYLRYYATDVFRNFLCKMKEELPANLPVLLFIDNDLEDAGLSIHLISKERWDGFCVFGRGFFSGSVDYLWNPEGISAKAPVISASQAIIIPPESFTDVESLQGFYLLVDHFQNKEGKVRLIPDPDLIFEWHGLDNVFVASQCVEGEGLRRLQGFVAAGGEVSVFGPSLSLFNETVFA